jgi:hypothetical protein
MHKIKLGNKSFEPAGNRDDFPRISIPYPSPVFLNYVFFFVGFKLFAVTQSVFFTGRTKDAQTQTTVQLGQTHVHKNPELIKYYSIAQYLLRSLF